MPGSSVMTVRATWNGEVIAESDDTLVVERNHYFPIEDVRRDLLESSPTQSVCPWKGRANYYTVVVDGQRNLDAAWYYPSPSKAAAGIAGRVAFWHGVRITRADGDGAAEARGLRRLWRRSA